jgi:hypothetical protein
LIPQSKNAVDVRSLLKQRAGEKKKVEHPMAKYTGQGQLMCVVCSVMVKNDMMWPVHLKGKQHKEVCAGFYINVLVQQVDRADSELLL